ncbi:hypothetical protein TRFO_32064 [Tritrichomonas foetus]|uniref:Leucine Rich Repeat family protein n=1 Tax=Tritrichomonas foetus TaxID=1144522 RepID=A0A1J4JQ92_9EUKA|nr:hypothetical protein TRFO_32064 [Tritrichomonas foetus]|eukprot:OHT01219.1 hypothetical protein TRFO_32064 [Tritrichomonas foetus]
MSDILTESLVKKRTKLSPSEVKNLDLWGYQLADVSLIEKMPKLEIASLSLNKITTLKSFKGCTQLRNLFLRDNSISDFDELNHLVNLPSLHTLWLSGNPISEDPSYRERVMQILPKLAKLDEDEITDIERMQIPKTLAAKKSSRSKMPVAQSFPDITKGSSPKADMSSEKLQQEKKSSNVSPVRPPTGSKASSRISSNFNSNSSSNSGSYKSDTKSTVKHSSSAPAQDIEKESARPHRRNDKPVLNAIMELLPELSQESLDAILQRARDLRNQ